MFLLLATRFLLSQRDLQDCPSFNDDGLSEIFTRWKGTCMAQDDYKKSYFSRNFVIQCGDQLGPEKEKSTREINSKLLHSGWGVVSMANSNLHINGFEFFIPCKSANQQHCKHPVFGGVVGGLTILAVMKKVHVFMMTVADI
ncbi:hypothetical protein C5167_022789, partial [Papaver somniferum]